MEKHHIRVCGIEDSNYPRLLKHCADAPLVLFYKGILDDSDSKNIAIVGTRKATEMGKKRVDTLLHELAETGYHPNIISGLAYGIDITAHTACMHYGLKAARRSRTWRTHGLSRLTQKYGLKDSRTRGSFNFRISDLRTDFTDKFPPT